MKDMGSEMLALNDFHTSHYLVVHGVSFTNLPTYDVS